MADPYIYFLYAFEVDEDDGLSIFEFVAVFVASPVPS